MSDTTKQQRLPYTAIAPEGIAPMRALEHYLNALSGLEAPLLEMVRLRVSRINGCLFCIGLHTHALRRYNEPEERIESVDTWRGSDVYTQRERAALAWAETLTAAQGEVPETDFAAASSHFSAKELVDLSLAIASINAWNRLGIAFLPQWDESKAGGSKALAGVSNSTVDLEPTAGVAMERSGAEREGDAVSLDQDAP